MKHFDRFLLKTCLKLQHAKKNLASIKAAISEAQAIELSANNLKEGFQPRVVKERRESGRMPHQILSLHRFRLSCRLLHLQRSCWIRGAGSKSRRAVVTGAGF